MKEMEDLFYDKDPHTPDVIFEYHVHHLKSK